MMRSSALLLAVLSCGSHAAGGDPAAEPRPGEAEGTQPADPPRSGLAVAVFAGGCFWCMEHPFERLDGVGEAVSGYAGGRERAPTYAQVSAGRTGHLEAVRVVYDPERVSYEQLLEVFWHNVDPTQDDGQFCDRGAHYRSAIFVSSPEERRLAEESKRRVAARLGRRVVTEIRNAGAFWVAEAYHQDYYRTNAARYQSYRQGCGRDAHLRELWGEDAGH